MSKIADLLPCPFCGGKADFSETNAWWVRCNECNAETEADMSPEAAAEIWNRRTPPPQTHVDGWNAHEEFKRSALAARQAFDHVVGKPTRLATVGKHEARNLQHLKGVYEAALEQSPEFADTLAWLLWWEIAKFDRLAELTQSSPAPVQHVAPSKAHESIARIIGDYVDLSDSRYAQMLAYVLDEVPEPTPEKHVGLQDGTDWTEVCSAMTAKLQAEESTPPPSTHVAWLEDAIRGEGYVVGIAMSVAFLIRDRDEPSTALEWWRASGLTVEQCERANVDDYDLAPIRAALTTTEGSR